MKKLFFTIGIVSKFFLLQLVIVFFCTITNAQEDEFLTKVTQTHINNISSYRDKLLRDKHRPTYHFVVPEGIAEPFDPNGAIFWNGRYHLFYIFQNVKPRRGFRGDSWGHVSSHDLVHWRFHPTALKPSGSEVAIYSGNAFVNKDGVPTIMYQGLGAGNCIAYSYDEDLNDWTKSRSNPVVPYPEVEQDHDRATYREILDNLPEYGKYDVWDPHCWLDSDTYYAIFGDNWLWPGPEATLWKSKNLEKWDFLGNFFHHNMPDVGEDGNLDCPDFFKIGDKSMLLFLSGGTQYYIGEFKNEQFYPEIYGRMNWPGGQSHAPESLIDDKGRRIMWAWATDPRTSWGRRDKKITEHGWSGTLTLPRVLTLDDDEILHIEPVEELKVLRTNHQQIKNLSLAKNSEQKIDAIKGDCLELNLTINPQKATECGIKVRCSPEKEEETSIIYNPEKKSIRINLAKSTLDEDIKKWYEDNGFKQEAPFELGSDELLNLHIFLDRSIMEVFINGRLCLTQRIYPTRDDSQEIRLFSRGGRIRVPVFDAWKMFPSNPW